LRGFVSIILNPFLRVFAISAFLKVIHAPKTPNFRYPKKFFFKKFLKKKFSGFSLFGQETLDMGVFIYLLGSPDCEDLKKYM
jgi:hypothetical protein